MTFGERATRPSPLLSIQYNGHVTLQMTATRLKAELLSVLDEVANGEEVEITRHGRTIARLIPARRPGNLRDIFKGVAMTAPGVADEDLFSTELRWDVQDQSEQE